MAVSMNARTPTPTPQTQQLTNCQHTRNGMAVSIDARTPALRNCNLQPMNITRNVVTISSHHARIISYLRKYHGQS